MNNIFFDTAEELFEAVSNVLGNDYDVRFSRVEQLFNAGCNLDEATAVIRDEDNRGIDYQELYHDKEHS